MKKRTWSIFILALTLLLGIIALTATPTLAEGAEEAARSRFFQTGWALFPPLVAIVLALTTKEVYSALFVGIMAGGLLYSDFNFEGAMVHVFSDGIAASLGDMYNVGILVFLVILGIIVSMLNRVGASGAFGNWAVKHVKTRVGAQLAVVGLGILIFIDDYFNCLTVGSVMRPICDKQKISRAKLAYMIDSTAAPVCILAPVSSWAAAVSSYVEGGNGLQVFLKAIPFNFYAILTMFMLLLIAITGIDYGKMKDHERNAVENDDIYSGVRVASEKISGKGSPRAKMIDLVFPILTLILCSVLGMVYSGGIFEGKAFFVAFAEADASIGLMLGSALALMLIVVYYVCRRLIPFKSLMDCMPEGFRSMVPAMLILTFAWTLKVMVDSLGAQEFLEVVVRDYAGGFTMLLPAAVFAIASLLAFATGASWSVFGIMIPVTLGIFPITDPLGVVCVSACMAGSVCGDHCSPISDTTIMSSAGAQCDHMTHVYTQLPYAGTVAVVSFLCYIISGFIPNAAIVLPIGAGLLVIALLVLNRRASIRKKRVAKAAVRHSHV